MDSSFHYVNYEVLLHFNSEARGSRKKKAVYYLLLYNRQTKMTVWLNDHIVP